MKEIGKFLAKILGVVLIILFAFWVGSKIWNSINVPTCPECVCEEVSTAPDVPTGDVTFTQEEKVCRFAEDYTSEGVVVPEGTKITGPALVKPDRNRDHVILLMPSAEYTTSLSDEVIWLLIGDSACVDSQAAFFSSSETVQP